MLKESQEHKDNKFKLIGGQATAYVVLAFFAFVFIYYSLVMILELLSLFHHSGSSSYTSIIKV